MSNDIYSYIETNFEIKITDYQFKRDYIKEPLKKYKMGRYYFYEKPFKEDIEYLYITINLMRENICSLLNVSTSYLNSILKMYSIKKDSKKIQNNREKNNIKKYNCINISQLEDIKNKKALTFFNKYGASAYLISKEFTEIRKQKNFKKYGVEYYFQSDDFKGKYKKICLEKFNNETYLGSEDWMKKMKEICLNNYGVEYYFQSNEYKNLYTDRDWVKKKTIKRWNTMKNSNSFYESKKENEIYELLIQKYPDTIRQHKSDLYPFACDFYIPELDLYIEYQGYFTHGPINFNYNGKIYNCHCPYDPNDLIHQEVINFWKSKNTKQYNKAINDWTIRDPLKRETAKKNNLNWIEFFNMNEFMEWYNQI